MKFTKSIFVIFLLICGFNCVVANAQNTSQSKQIRILHNYGHIPFEDGKTTIAEVSYIGFDSDQEKYDSKIFGNKIPEKDFLTILKDKKANIVADEKFSGAKVSKAVKAIKENIRQRYGYLDAKVVAYGEMLPKNRMKLIFSVKRGNPAFVSEILFEGNKRVLSEELGAEMRKCLDDNNIFYQRYFDYCANKNLREFLFSKGFFRAKIHSVTPKLVSNNYVVKISIDEGIRFVYGTIKFEGATVFSEKELTEMLGWKTGEVANGKYFQNAIYEDLKKAYANEGHIEYNAEFEPTFIEPQTDGLDGIVNIVVNIEKGKQFNLGKIKFIGIDEDDKRKFIEMIPLKTGEVYNQSKLDEGIKKINELKQFLPIESMRGTLISKDEGYSGIEVRLSENGSDVQVIIATRKLTDDEREYYKELFERRD